MIGDNAEEASEEQGKTRAPVHVTDYYDYNVVENESSWPVILSLLVAGFGALLAWQNVCAEQHVCVKHGTCYPVRNASYSCAFRTSITPSASRMLNFLSLIHI